MTKRIWSDLSLKRSVLKRFSKFMIWVLKNARNCSSYLEIGSRWCGTFIVTCEVLWCANPSFMLAIASNLIEVTPFIERLSGALKDHMLVRQFSNIIVYHDACSDTCPKSTML